MAERGRSERVLIDGVGALLDGEGPLRGPLRSWRELGLRRAMALLVEVAPGEPIERGTLRWIGPSAAADRPGWDRRLDLGGALVTPGLVDAHTHAVFAGDRGAELMARLAGATYQELAAAGGGILATVAATRAASPAALRDGLIGRLDELAAWGARIVEVKTGYGLSLPAELACLDAIAAAAQARPALRLVATLMPAHAVPPEFSGRGAAYVDAILAWLPALAAHPVRPAFMDVFIEPGYFAVADAERLAAAAGPLGLGLKAHVDEFEAIGGLDWAVARGARSVEHLLASDDAALGRLAASATVAVALPLVSIFLGQPMAKLRALVDAGALLAVATDCNPGSAMSTNLLLAAQLAVFAGRLTPAEALRAVTRGGALALAAPGGYDGRLRVGGPACLTRFDLDHPDALFYQLGAPPRALPVEACP